MLTELQIRPYEALTPVRPEPFDILGRALSKGCMCFERLSIYAPWVRAVQSLMAEL